MATMLSQIRLSLYSSRPAIPTTRDTFNRSSSSIKTNPVKKSMHHAPHRRERMAHSQTKHQQAGSCRPNYISDNQENSVRSRPGGARPLSETHRKPHRQDREQRDADLMKSLPRQPKRRKPLQNVDYNAEQRNTPRGPRQHRAPGPEASTESLQTQEHLSNMYSMIDDHLAWNMSASDLTYHSPELSRPASSGTMFVDFGSNGEVEVSYRNGVNKRLPAPPVPSKLPAPSKPIAPRQAVQIKTEVQSKPQRSEIKQAKPKPLPLHPSYSSRHDSVISSGVQQSGHINPLLPPPFPAPNRPLPPLPAQTPLNPQSRRSYPPQVHTTSRSVSTTKVHSSPALSTTSTTTYHTAHDVETGGESDDAVHTVIEPEGLTTSYHSHGLAPRVTAGLQAVQQSPHFASRPASLAPSRTDTHKEITSSYPSAYAHSSSSASLKRLDTNKPLPAPPPAARDYAYHDTRCKAPVVLKKEQKRRKVITFVKKVLCKTGDISDKFNEHQHRYEHVEKRR